MFRFIVRLTVPGLDHAGEAVPLQHDDLGLDAERLQQLPQLRLLARDVAVRRPHAHEHPHAVRPPLQAGNIFSKNIS